MRCQYHVDQGKLPPIPNRHLNESLVCLYPAISLEGTILLKEMNNIFDTSTSIYILPTVKPLRPIGHRYPHPKQSETHKEGERTIISSLNPLLHSHDMNRLQSFSFVPTRLAIDATHAWLSSLFALPAI
jgi:hypothetical protein